MEKAGGASRWALRQFYVEDPAGQDGNPQDRILRCLRVYPDGNGQCIKRMTPITFPRICTSPSTMMGSM